MVAPLAFAKDLSPAPLATIPEAPLRSRTAGFPGSGSDLGYPALAFPMSERLKCWHTYLSTFTGLPSHSSS